MTREGWQKEKGLSILAFSSDKMNIGVGAAEIGDDPVIFGEIAVKAAIKNADKEISDNPKQY